MGQPLAYARGGGTGVPQNLIDRIAGLSDRIALRLLRILRDDCCAATNGLKPTSQRASVTNWLCKVLRCKAVIATCGHCSPVYVSVAS